MICTALAMTSAPTTPSTACITGGIAEAYYKEIPSDLAGDARNLLPPRFIEVIDKVRNR